MTKFTANDASDIMMNAVIHGQLYIAAKCFKATPAISFNLCRPFDIPTVS